MLFMEVCNLSQRRVKHELVPEHILLNQTEIDILLSRYRIQPYQLPHIKSSDPAIIAIGGKSGDIVKIIRISSTSGETESYRYVIEG
jgi:DNA-directed RNA polymerase subunit H